MEETIKKNVAQLLESIYKLEIKKMDEEFIQLINSIEEYISTYSDKGWNTVLLNMQDAYSKKDYVRFADILLYELSPML